MAAAPLRVKPKLRGVFHEFAFFAAVLLAAGCPPFCLPALSRGWSVPGLTFTGTGATAAILLKLFWPGLPKRASAAIGLGLGWVVIVAFTQLLKLPLAGLVLVLAGGLA